MMKSQRSCHHRSPAVSPLEAVASSSTLSSDSSFYVFDPDQRRRREQRRRRLITFAKRAKHFFLLPLCKIFHIPHQELSRLEHTRSMVNCLNVQQNDDDAEAPLLDAAVFQDRWDNQEIEVFESCSSDSFEQGFVY
jgi:hypothetical protein